MKRIYIIPEIRVVKLKLESVGLLAGTNIGTPDIDAKRMDNRIIDDSDDENGTYRSYPSSYTE